MFYQNFTETIYALYQKTKLEWNIYQKTKFDDLINNYLIILKEAIIPKMLQTVDQHWIFLAKTKNQQQFSNDFYNFKTLK